MRKYRRPHRVRKKKSILRSRFFWLGFLALAAAGAVFYFLFFSEVFRIKRVAVEGGDVSLSAAGENIFLIDTSELRKDILKRFPGVAQVEIDRSFPDTLNITVRERQAVALWCKDTCFFIDIEGVPFEAAPEKTDLIKILGDKELLSGINHVLEIKSKLAEELALEIGKADLVSSQRLDVETSEGWKIYFDLEGDLDWQIQKLGLVLEKQIPPERRGTLEYVDLRFSRIYYK